MQLDEDWRIHFKAKRYDKAEAVLKEVLKKDTGWVGPDHRFVAVDNIGLGRVYMAQKRYKEAEPHLLRGLAIYEKLYGMDHPAVGDVASALTRVGNLNLGLKRFKEAEERYLRAIPMYKKALQGASPAKYSPPEKIADPYYKRISATASMATENLFGLAKSYIFQKQY